MEDPTNDMAMADKGLQTQGMLAMARRCVWKYATPGQRWVAVGMLKDMRWC